MKRIQAIGYALAAALFYALSIPCAKLLLEQIAHCAMRLLQELTAQCGAQPSLQKVGTDIEVLPRSISKGFEALYFIRFLR